MPSLLSFHRKDFHVRRAKLRGVQEGLMPLFLYVPLSFQERGIKGVRLINDLANSAGVFGGLPRV